MAVLPERRDMHLGMRFPEASSPHSVATGSWPVPRAQARPLGFPSSGYFEVGPPRAYPGRSSASVELNPLVLREETNEDVIP